MQTNVFAKSCSAFLFVSLSACTVIPATNPQDASGCYELVVPASGALVAVTDPTLLAQAIGQPGEGKLCQGQVLKVEKPLWVYRVWDQAKPYTLYGSWWSFQPPGSNRQQYRLDNAICPEWSALDLLSVCEVKIGSKLVIGPGQSAECKDGVALPTSPVHQVFLPNNLTQHLIQVENCSPGIPWPDAKLPNLH